MKNKILKLSAMLMVSLVIMLPIYTSSVVAQFYRVDIKGQDDIPGYIREYDYIDLTVDVYVDEDDDVSPNQIRFLTGRTNFSSCVGPNIDETFTCVVRYPQVDTLQFLMNEYPVSINLYDDYGELTDTYFKPIVVDREKPVITVFDVRPKSTSSEDITFNYRIEDYAYRIGSTNKCSGISYIQLYTFDGSLIRRIDFDGSDCVISDSITIENSEFGEGVNVVYAKTEDRFEHESAFIYTSFNIDRTPVSISSIAVVDEYGNDILYIGREGAIADVDVKIIGTDLEKESVYGDFSELNVDITDYVEKAECDETDYDNVTICSWYGIEIKLDSSGSKDIKVTADDKAGNRKTAALKHSFVFDDQGPTVTGIRSDNVRGTENYARASGNNFIATLVETGIGLDPSDIMLHIGRWSAGAFVDERGFPLGADNCETGWTCYWNNVNLFHEGNFVAYIGDDSADKLGNPAEEGFSADVTADFSKPELTSLDITALGGALPAFAGYVKTYDSLQITAVVREENILKEAYGDFSAVIDGAGKILADGCEEEGNTYTCTWQTTPIDMQGYIVDELKFYFTDQAGNTLEAIEPIEVYEVTNISLDFWRHKVSCTPRNIDRQTTALINHRVYCHIELESSEAEVISMSLAGCEGGAMEVVEEAPTLFNDQAGSTDPYIKIVLRAEDMAYDALDFKCNLNVISRVGTRIGRYPELEEVELSIGMYNMPLGTYGEGVQDLIDDSKDFAWYIDDWVEDLNELFHYGEALCKTLSTLVTLGGTLGAIGAALGISAQGALATPGGLTVAEKLDEARKNVQRAQQGVGGLIKGPWGDGLVKFCKFFSCRLFFDEWFKDGKKKGTVTNKIGQWQRSVLEGANWVAKGGIRGGTEVWGNRATGYELGPIQGAKLSPKESIVISTLTLCIPGIVYNLNKLRQIQCMYVGCLQNNAAAGLPLRACEMQKHYATCKYWWGEIFQLLPFTGLINYIVGLIKKIFSSPFGFVDTTLAFVCEYQIEAKQSGALAHLCLINDIAGLVANLYADLEGIGESWKISDDYCDNI